MKISKFYFLLSLVAVFFLGTFVVVVSAEGEKAGAAAAASEEPPPSKPINCDHKCGARLRVDTMTISREKNKLSKKLLGRSFHASAVTEQYEKYQERLVRVTALEGIEKTNVEQAIRELESSQRASLAADQKVDDCRANSETKIAKLEAELRKLHDEIEEYEQIRFQINFEVLKSDVQDYTNIGKSYIKDLTSNIKEHMNTGTIYVQDLLKKYGLMKD